MAVFTANDETFDTLVGTGAAVVDFYSTHCGPCRVLLSMLLQLEARMPFLRVIKVNTDECPELTERFQIAGVPTVYLCRNGSLKEYRGPLEMGALQSALAELLYRESDA